MTTKKGNIVGLALDNWLEYLGPWLTNTEAYNSFYFNYSIGTQNFSTAANPWTLTIFHEAPGIFK